MSTRARKERKRRGEKLPVKIKVPTPPEQRSYVVGMVPGPDGTKHAGKAVARSPRKVEQYLRDRGVDPAVLKKQTRRGGGRGR